MTNLSFIKIFLKLVSRDFFIWFFFVIIKLSRIVWYFNKHKILFKIKGGWCVQREWARVWKAPITFYGAWSISRRPKISLHRNMGIFTRSSFSWGGLRQQQHDGLSLVTFISLVLLFSLILVKFTLTIQNFRIVLLFIDISTLVFILLIFNFCSWSFCKILICFQFYHSIPICYTLFFIVWFSLFDCFFGHFVKMIFIFNFTIQSKLCSYPLIYFLFQFWSLLF